MSVPTLTFLTTQTAREVLKALTDQVVAADVFICAMSPLNFTTLAKSDFVLEILVAITPGMDPVHTDVNRDKVYATQASFGGDERWFPIEITIPTRMASNTGAIVKLPPEALDIRDALLEES